MTGVLDILESVDNSSSVISYIGFDVSSPDFFISGQCFGGVMGVVAKFIFLFFRDHFLEKIHVY